MYRIDDPSNIQFCDVLPTLIAAADLTVKNSFFFPKSFLWTSLIMLPVTASCFQILPSNFCFKFLSFPSEILKINSKY